MKKTMEKAMRAVGAIISLVSLFVGVYVIFSTSTIAIFELIMKYDTTKLRYSLAHFFGLLTSDEIDILEEDEGTE